MSELIDPRRPNGASPHDEGGHATMSPTGPLRPEHDSALDRLLRRQTLTVPTGRLLSYVPAQVR